MTKKEIKEAKKVLDEELLKLQTEKAKREALVQTNTAVKDQKLSADALKERDEEADIIAKVLDASQNDPANDEEGSLVEVRKSSKLSDETAQKKDSADIKDTEEVAASLDKLPLSKDAKKNIDALESLLDASTMDKLMKDSGESTNEKRSAKKGGFQNGKCKDASGISKDYCESLKKAGYCDVKEYKEHLKKMCPKTCELCDPCLGDAYDEKHCAMLRDRHLCVIPKFKERMKKLCYVTCGYCKAPSQAACHYNKHGCCWDGHTARTPHGKCPPCQNSNHVRTICERFAKDSGSSSKSACHAVGLPGEWMKKFCPVSCGLCNPELEDLKDQCQDDRRLTEECDTWVANGECKTDEVVRNELCKYSCKTCDVNQIEHEYHTMVDKKQ